MGKTTSWEPIAKLDLPRIGQTLEAVENNNLR